MIEKKMVIRRVGSVYSYQGFVREAPEDPTKDVAWDEATEVITEGDVRRAAPESEVREYCMKQTDLYLLRTKNFPVIEEEELF